MHGYEIMKEISMRTDGLWRPTAGSIYPALSSLEDDGYIERKEMSQGNRVILNGPQRHMQFFSITKPHPH